MFFPFVPLQMGSSEPFSLLDGHHPFSAVFVHWLSFEERFIFVAIHDFNYYSNKRKSQSNLHTLFRLAVTQFPNGFSYPKLKIFVIEFPENKNWTTLYSKVHGVVHFGEIQGKHWKPHWENWNWDAKKKEIKMYVKTLRHNLSIFVLILSLKTIIENLLLSRFLHTLPLSAYEKKTERDFPIWGGPMLNTSTA